MKKMKRVVSLAVILCMAISMAILFCGCDERAGFYGSTLPLAWMGTYRASDGQTVKIVSRDGDGIYWDCPKLYAKDATVTAYRNQSTYFTKRNLFNDTIQKVYQLVDSNSDGGVIRYYDDYKFSAEHMGAFTSEYMDCNLYKNNGKRYLLIEYSGYLYTDYYSGSKTFVKQ